MQEWLKEVDMDLVLKYTTPVIGVLLLLFFGWIVAGWVGRITRNALKRARIDLTIARFLGNMAKWAVLIFVLLGCLSLFGVEITAFAAVLAAMGFAIGMAFQGTLSNFAAGIMLIVFRPFDVGDVVKVAGYTGTIYAIDLFVTTMDTSDNRRLIIPNGDVFGSTIENITHHDTRRVDVLVGTEYGADLDAARQVLLDAASSVPNILADPAPSVVLRELGDSSVNWTVRVWTKTTDYWSARDALTRAVKMSLDSAHIGIPFPQMDVHMPLREGAVAPAST